MTEEVKQIIDQSKANAIMVYDEFVKETNAGNILTQNYGLGRARGFFEGTLSSLYLTKQITKEEAAELHKEFLNSFCRP